MAFLHFILAAVLSLAWPAMADHSGHWSTLLTFNAYLASNSSFTPFYDQRRLAQFASIASSSSPWATADVVCMQEMFLRVDRDEYDRVAKLAGFTWSFASGRLETDDQLTGVACPAHKIPAVQRCATTQCASTANERELSLCLATFCSDELASLSQACVNCLIISRGDLTAKLTHCASMGQAATFGSNLGLMLFSKKEISNAQLIPFSNRTDLFRRGYIQADIKELGTVLCTHLYPVYTDEAPAIISLFTETNVNQTRQLAAAAESQSAIIIGDINSGPANVAENVSALSPMSYSHLLDRGFFNPYANLTGALCTFCKSNRFLELTNYTEPDVLIDNVLYLPHLYEADQTQTKRVFTEDVVEISPGIRIPLSDHYGLQVRVRSDAHALLPRFVLLLCATAIAVMMSSA